MCRDYCSLSQCELPAVRRKPALLVDELIPPKTLFLHKIMALSPENAGWGVLLF